MKEYLAKKKIGFYVSVIATILAIVSLVLYLSASNQLDIVKMLIAVTIVAELAYIILSKVMGNNSYLSLATLISTVLMGAALAQSFTTQVDALGYAVAGLYTIDQVMPFIRFAVVAAVAFLVYLISSFMDLDKDK